MEEFECLIRKNNKFHSMQFKYIDWGKSIKREREKFFNKLATANN